MERKWSNRCSFLEIIVALCSFSSALSNLPASPTVLMHKKSDFRLHYCSQTAGIQFPSRFGNGIHSSETSLVKSPCSPSSQQVVPRHPCPPESSQLHFAKLMSSRSTRSIALIPRSNC